MVIKVPSIHGSIITISLPLFLMTLTRSQKAQQLFTHADLRIIVINVQTKQAGPTRCYTASCSIISGPI
jgi:hypothetical protein